MALTSRSVRQPDARVRAPELNGMSIARGHRDMEQLVLLSCVFMACTLASAAQAQPKASQCPRTTGSNVREQSVRSSPPQVLCSGP
jgi:hypothetical protein